MKKKLLIVGLLVILFSRVFAQNGTQYYVSLTGSDNNNGTISSPFASIQKAQQVVKNKLNSNNPGNYQVILRQGTYTLSAPLVFDASFNNDINSSVEFKAYPGEQVILCGGKVLPKTWTKTANPNIWKLTIPALFGNNVFFQSVFKNDRRVPNASSDTLYSAGPIKTFEKQFKKYDFVSKNRLTKDSMNVFCGFTYLGNDLDNITDIDNVELVQYNSWEASLHRILKIDRANKVVYLKTPATYPVGFFNNRVRYLVKNTSLFLTKANRWYFDAGAKQLYYYAANGENPNTSKFVIPVADTLIKAVGIGKNNLFINNVKFSNITFSYSKSAWGVNIAPEADKQNNSKRYRWMDFSQGFSGGQTAIDCGAAVVLEACKGWSFNNCSFTHLGNYALAISKYSAGNTVINCAINDNGGGGIIVGFNYIGGLKSSFANNISPSDNKILNCTINSCGVIFPAAVGIGIMQANHTLVSHNEIFDLPYSGISVGWTFSAEENYTSYNTIEYNSVHDVMKILADGAGIYTLGRQKGSVYRGNSVYNVYHNVNSIGARNNGFFFDQNSSGMNLDSNIVYHVKDEAIRFNMTDSTRMKFLNNYFEKINTNNSLMKVIQRKVAKEK